MVDVRSTPAAANHLPDDGFPVEGAELGGRKGKHTTGCMLSGLGMDFFCRGTMEYPGV